MALTDAELKRLRSALLQRRPTRPLEAMVGLARAGPAGRRLTIDFAASDTLGAPVVVVEPQPPSFDGHGLTKRERQVAALVAEGLRNREIAQRLGITVATTKDHVHRVLSKLGLPSRAALAARRGGP